MRREKPSIVLQVGRGKPKGRSITKSESPLRTDRCFNDGNAPVLLRCSAQLRHSTAAQRRRRILLLPPTRHYYTSWCSATGSRSIRWHCHTLIVVDCVLLEAKAGSHTPHAGLPYESQHCQKYSVNPITVTPISQLLVSS